MRNLAFNLGKITNTKNRKKNNEIWKCVHKVVDFWNIECH